MQSNIVKWGNSSAVRLTKSILQTVKMKENDPVSIIAEEDKIIISKQEVFKHKSLQERFANFNEEYTQEEFNWGKEGKEIW